MPIQSFSFEVKQLTEKGKFSGLASTYGNVDLAGDVVMPGAFTRTLSDAGKSRPLLWQHRTGDPVGLVQLTDSLAGLVAEGQLSLGIQQGRDAYQLLKDSVIRGLSIGFLTIKEQFVGDVRQLLELKLYEVSLVTFPANEQATIAGVKAVQQAAHRDKIHAALKSLRRDVLDALEGKK